MTDKITSVLFATIMFITVAGCAPDTSNEVQPNKTTTPNTSKHDNFDTQIEGKYWQLIALYGQPDIKKANQQQAIHIKLNAAEHKVNGFAGCNKFFGNYELTAATKRVRFSEIATNLMACADTDDRALLKVLELTDNYTITNDRLYLNVGRRAPLAVLQALHTE